MKKITFLTFLFVLISIPLSYGQTNNSSQNNGLNSMTGSSVYLDQVIPEGIQNSLVDQINSRSMVTNVLVAGAPGDPNWINEVETTLESTGLIAADTYLLQSGTPTLSELNAYDAILLFTDTGSTNPTLFGDNLAQYLEAGGGVVDATFHPNVSGAQGNFSQYMLYIGGGQSQPGNVQIGSVYDSSHPIMDGVSSFNGGTASYYNSGGSVATGASVVADNSAGEPFIIVNDNVGPANAKRAFLNFYPPSDLSRSDFWVSSTDGALLMANALAWVGGATPPPPTGPTLDFTFCSEEMPLEFAPPIIASAGVMVADSGYPSDTGVVGSGLGEYVLESMVVNAQAGSAEDVDFSLQSPSDCISA